MIDILMLRKNIIMGLFQPKRPDGELVPTISKFQELMFHLMHGRNESVVYFHSKVILDKTLKYLEEVNKNVDPKDKLTLFHIILCAAIRTIALRPKMNRFVAGRRLWQRNRIVFAFTVKKEMTEKGDEVNAMIEFDAFDTLDKVKKTVNDHINTARHGVNPNEKDIKFFGALPRWLIKFIFWFIRWNDEHNRVIYSITKDMPFFVSVYLAHLGSIGVDAAYHHPFEVGNAGIFIVIGNTHKEAIINEETDAIEIKRLVDLKFSFDERIAEGFYSGPSVYMLNNFIENPELLEKPPELTDKMLDKLMLDKYKEGRIKREKERKKRKKKE